MTSFDCFGGGGAYGFLIGATQGIDDTCYTGYNGVGSFTTFYNLGSRLMLELDFNRYAAAGFRAECEFVYTFYVCVFCILVFYVGGAIILFLDASG